MPVVSRFAGLLIAPLFVNSGINGLRSPGLLTPRVEHFTTPLAEKVPMLPKDASTLVRINAAAQVAGGVLLGLGKYRRLGALLLIDSLILTTWAAHGFWNIDDPTARAAERTQFEKNLAILGALLLILFGGGKKRRPAAIRVTSETPEPAARAVASRAVPSQAVPSRAVA